MITETEGVILRQVKALNGRRMISMFSKKYGKISVGASVNEGGRNKTALAVKPFCYGRYELFKNRDNYSLNGGSVIKSYYALGEDLDKYMAASYVLEFTDKILPEELPQPKIFSLLLEFFDVLERREKKHGTVVMAYLIKILDAVGMMPELETCACCGKKELTGSEQVFFSIEEGGIICPDCAAQLLKEQERPLIYKEQVGIIDILRYFQKQPLAVFEKIALDESMQRKLRKLIKEYVSYHMDIGELKSESFFQI